MDPRFLYPKPLFLDFKIRIIITIDENWRPYAESLRSIYLEERRKTFTWVDGQSFRLADFDTQTENELIIVARDGEQVAGFISIWMDDDFIHHLYVGRQFQNRGIGRALLKAAGSKVGPVIRLKCLVNNVNAERFYRRLGFIEMSRGKSEHGEYILFEKLNR